MWGSYGRAWPKVTALAEIRSWFNLTNIQNFCIFVFMDTTQTWTAVIGPVTPGGTYRLRMYDSSGTLTTAWTEDQYSSNGPVINHLTRVEAADDIVRAGGYIWSGDHTWLPGHWLHSSLGVFATTRPNVANALQLPHSVSVAYCDYRRIDRREMRYRALLACGCTDWFTIAAAIATYGHCRAHGHQVVHEYLDTVVGVSHVIIER